MNRNILSAVVVAAVLAAGCSSPLATRRARVTLPGQLEVTAAPYIEATTINPLSSVSGASSGTAIQPFAYPFGEAAARFGLMDKLDMQIKVDPTIIPEVSVGYELIGDPKKNEFALTLTGGVKPTVIALGTVFGGLITTPVQVIADVPFGDTVALVLGVRAIPAVLFGGVGGTAGGGAAITIAPGGFAAVHFQIGNFFVRPEIAGSSLVTLAGSGGGVQGAPTPVTLNAVAALDVGYVFDFTPKAAEPDTTTPPPPPPPPPAAAPPPAPAPAPAPPAPAPLAPSDPSEAGPSKS